MSDQPAPEHQRPDGVSDETIEALGKLSAAMDHIEDARGHIYAFHRLMGSAERTMEEATELVRKAGHVDIADALDTEVLVDSVRLSVQTAYPPDQPTGGQDVLGFTEITLRSRPPVR